MKYHNKLFINICIISVIYLSACHESHEPSTSSEDEPQTCQSGFVDCDHTRSNGCETDLNTQSNCGQCGRSCNDGQVCAQGVCASECPASDGYAKCGDHCIQLARQHYAKCDTCVENWCDLDNNTATGCEADAHKLHLNTTCSDCNEGYCDLDDDLSNGCEKTTSELHYSTCGTCASGYQNCDANPANGCETNTQEDSENCGACGIACQAYEFCIEGQCLSQCRADQGNVLCGHQCTHLSAKNLASCDTCLEGWCDMDNNKASTGCESHAQTLHLNATCDGCEAGWCNLDKTLANGCETNAALVHLNDDCTACAAGFCDLDQNADNGCEANLSIWHLSACTECQNEWCDADNDLTNGCEANTRISSDHCGACGNKCPENFVCIDGSCEIQCAANETRCSKTTCFDLSKQHWLNCEGQCAENYADCDGKISNGCETSLLTQNNCGACGNDCGPKACIHGVCDVCNSGWLHCNDLCVDIKTDRLNCGACGNQCQSNAICADGTCQCEPEFTSCGSAGCVDLKTDPQHCGDCSIDCGEGQSCADGACQCEPEFTSCGSAGCVDLKTDSHHCGDCNIDCGDHTCFEGTCLDVPAGYTQCGTEFVDLKTDIHHCGACDVDLTTDTVLHVTHVQCQDGTPILTCETDEIYEYMGDDYFHRWADCDGQPTNGCEADLRDDFKNCGKCQNSCITCIEFACH